jgi:hypothetical protein
MFQHLRAGSGADLATHHATQFATRIPGEKFSRPVFAFVLEYAKGVMARGGFF